VTFESFVDLAGRMYDEIPQAFREGLTGVTVEREARGHATLSGIWTMGECVTDQWPDPTGGIGDTRSEIILYHGSFREIAEGDPLFEWKAELWETVLHEILHHREAAAAEDGLDLFDWAVDQNYRRVSGLEFDPFFHRLLPRDSEGLVRLDGETFVDVSAGRTDTMVAFRWRGIDWSVRIPLEASVLWARVRNLAGGRLWLIAERRSPWWRRLARDRSVELWEMDRRALPLPPT
jgi:hypothetical protein